MARAVRDYTQDGEGFEPWALTLARECGHFETIGHTQSGKAVRVYRLDRWPQVGGWHAQDEAEMCALNLAACTALVYSGKEWTADDRDFIAWVEAD